MKKQLKRFYMYDRWFEFEKETEDKYIYTSAKRKKGSIIHLEAFKDNKNIDILYLKDKVMIAKLSLENIDTDNIHIHYQEQEPQLITINDNIYVNLILELFTDIEKGRLVSDKVVKVNKKKKLNKMCYLEPDFPINEEIDLHEIEIESDVFDYFLNLIEYIKGYIKSLEFLMEHEDKKINPTRFINKKYKLNIAEELYIYDRSYTFVSKDDRTLFYENHEEGITNLEIKIDPNKYLTSINFIMENHSGITDNKDVFQIIRNELNGVTVRYLNRKKSNLRITGDEFKDYDSAKFRGISVYDSEANKVFDNIEIRAQNDEYVLSSHPVLSNVYIDEYGKTYRVNGQDFSKLDAMSDFAPGIFENVEKTLLKKVD